MRTRAVAGFLSAAVIAAASAGCSDDPDTPGNAVIAYATDYQMSDFEAAHERLCEDLQDEVTVEDLESREADERVPINPLESLRLTAEESVEDVRSPVQIVLGSVGGEEQTWEVGLVREERWRLCTFSRVR